MDRSSRKFEEAILESKKAVVRQCLERVAKLSKVKPPSVKFWDGVCPNSSEDEIAHYHPDKKQVCFSKIRLQQLDLDKLEDTTIHEFTHMFHLGHGPKFQQTHSNLSEAAWIAQHEGRKSVRIKRTKKRKGVCVYSPCKEKATSKCEYCGDNFCSMHTKPKPPGMPKFSSTKPADLLFMKEYHNPEGHPCPTYQKHWEDKNREREEKYNIALNTVLKSSKSYEKTSETQENTNKNWGKLQKKWKEESERGRKQNIREMRQEKEQRKARNRELNEKWRKEAEERRQQEELRSKSSLAAQIKCKLGFHRLQEFEKLHSGFSFMKCTKCKRATMADAIDGQWVCRDCKHNLGSANRLDRLRCIICGKICEQRGCIVR